MKYPDGLPPQNGQPWPSPARAWWTVAVLTFAYIVSFVDRTILSLLIEPIKADLGLGDTQIALVQGLAFGLFYALMGLPLGWLADRMSRRLLVAVGAGFWCLATCACGLASSFPQLFAARIGVGVGEAALSPAAMSLISDSFPRERRGLPIGVYAAAAAAGGGIALLLGGSIIQMVTVSGDLVLPLVGAVSRWQAAFLIVGVAGLVLVPLMGTVVEPARRDENVSGSTAERIDRFVWRNADFMVRHYVAVSVYSIIIYSTLSWAPAHFMRVFGWTAGEVGFRYGLVLLVFGGGGTVLGAWLAARLARRLRHSPIWVTALGMAFAGVLLALAGVAEDPWLALTWYAFGLLFMTLPGGTAIQVVQEAVPNALRGQASAIYYMFISVIGLTCGPLSVGLLNDYLFADPNRLGHSMAIVAAIVGPLTALLTLSTRAPFDRMLAAAERSARASAPDALR